MSRTKELEIRVAGSSDVDVLMRLIGGFRDHLGATTPSDEEVRTSLPAVLEDAKCVMTIAELAGEPVGYASLRFVPSVWTRLEAYLDDLFVFEAARGRQVGRALLDDAIARARTRGAQRFGLNTNQSNTRAQALYRAAGMAPKSHEVYLDSHEVVWEMPL